MVPWYSWTGGAGSEEAKIQRGGAPAARRYAALVNAQLQADGGSAGETAESPPGHCRQRALRHQDPSLREGADMHHYVVQI